ncbi:MAG: PQQ-binding-like beta-propeller repeat protein [Planctomycetota bacterium]
MNLAKTSFAILLAVLGRVTCGVAQYSPSWPMLGHDAHHSSRTSYQGPDELYELSRFAAQGEEVINCGAAVDQHGNVYFGTWGRYLSTDFQAASAVGGTEVWLVGDIVLQGGAGRQGEAVCFRRNAQWERLTCPSPRRLNSISMLSEQDGWSVGDGGILLSWNGVSWVEYGSPPTSSDLNSVHMIDAAEGWAVGAGGTILHYDGMWQLYPSPVSFDLHSVSFAPGGEKGWACGGFWYDNLLEYSNGAWHQVPSDQLGLWGSYSAVQAVSATEAWAVGGYFVFGKYLTVFLHYDGTDWSVFQSIESGPKLHGLAALDSSTGWAVGENSDDESGTIWRYQAGAGWYAYPHDPLSAPLRSVACRGDGSAWAVGDRCTIFCWDGVKWQPEREDLYTSNTTDGKFYAVAPDGGLLWCFDPGYVMEGPDQGRAGTIESTPAIDPARNRIYFGRGDGHIYAIDLTTGACDWTYDANQGETGLGRYSQIFAGVTIDREGNIYFVTSLPHISFNELDPDGNLVGRYDFGDSFGLVLGAPAVHYHGSEKMIYFVADNTVSAFSGAPLEGTLQWIYRGDPGEQFGLPTLSDDGGTLYVNSRVTKGRGRVHALLTQGSDAGKPKWTAPFVADEEAAGLVALGPPTTGRYLYVGSAVAAESTASPQLYILQDQGSIWAYAPVAQPAISFVDSAAVSSPVIDRDGDLYLVAGGRASSSVETPARVCAFRFDGTAKQRPDGAAWEFELDHPIMTLATLAIGHAGELYVGDAPCAKHNCGDAENTPHLYAVGNRSRAGASSAVRFLR